MPDQAPHQNSLQNKENSFDDGNNEHPAETRKNSRLALYIAFLALFFTAVGITVGYKHWLRIDDKARAALKEISIIHLQLKETANKSKVEELSTHLTESSNKAEQRLIESLHELDQIREQTTYSAQTVTDQIAELTLKRQLSHPASKKASQTTQLTQFAEVRFLLESAKRRLTMDYDKDHALQFLKAADQILIQINSTELLSVREKLAHDIAELERFTIQDTQELSATITQLEQDIKPLADLQKSLANGEPIQVFEDEDDSESLTSKVKTYINDSISIRKQTTLPRYAPNSSDKSRIDQLLQLRLESLRIMAMERHNTLYHQQIKSLKQMLELYYSVEDSKAWLATLDELDAEDLTPQRPNISSALDMLLQTSESDSSAQTAQAAQTVTQRKQQE